MQKKILSLLDVEILVRQCSEKIQSTVPSTQHRIYGVPRGGIPVAYSLLSHLKGSFLVEDPKDATIIVDDLIDSGATMTRYNQAHYKPFFALIDKRAIPPSEREWIVFPWENGETDTSGVDIPLRFLQYIGEDVNRDGLKDTPQRMLRAWGDIYAGYKQNPSEILGKMFENSEGYDEMVLLKDIEFYSTCEHHALPFFGKAHVAYIPTGKVVGISKLARLVDCFAKRMQIQERLTKQVVDALEEALHPLGAACVIEAQHLCMNSRGVGKQDSIMVTSALSGVFKTQNDTRSEFLTLIGRK